MQYRSDGLPESRLLRAGGFIGGILLATPFSYVVFDAAVRVFAAFLPIQAVVGAPLVLLPPSVATATVATGISLYGSDWIRSGGRWQGMAVAMILVASISAAAVVAAAIFVDAIRFGVEDGNPVPVAFGFGGVLALAWATIQGGSSIRAGYRRIE